MKNKEIKKTVYKVADHWSAWAELVLTFHLTRTPPSSSVVKCQLRYLHVDEKLPQVARRHHDGGVELDHVALVQGNVMVGSQALENKAGSYETEQLEPKEERFRACGFPVLTLWKSWMMSAGSLPPK